ncbi:hypothetical protein [Streptomyces lonarensis]|uniref:Uncharacterized protein n=1 Tax=Streptomyces lonarensis TaxID=700599 RepID=A0A7X6HX01_9ACTN|nr:hypothetical protein [Streptomyces lonarensis]NJQ04031.1 hypothetical protein [Streptomyces lonarensis]
MHDVSEGPAQEAVEPVRSLTWDGNRTVQGRRLGVDLILALREAGVEARTSYVGESHRFTVRLGWVGAAALVHTLGVAARVGGTVPKRGAVAWCSRARTVGVVLHVARGAVHLEALADGKPFRSVPGRLSHPTLQQIDAAREKHRHHAVRRVGRPLGTD